MESYHAKCNIMYVHVHVCTSVGLRVLNNVENSNKCEPVESETAIIQLSYYIYAVI